MEKGFKRILVLVVILFVLSVTALGANYYKFFQEKEGERRVFTPTTSSSTVDGVTYSMTEYSLSIRNHRTSDDSVSIDEESGKVMEVFNEETTKIKFYLDFSCYHCKRLFLSSLDEVEDLLSSSEPAVSFDFVIVDFFSLKSLTNWSDNSATILAYVAETEPENFLDVAKVLFQFQPEDLNGYPYTLSQMLSLVEEKTGMTVSSESQTLMRDGYYLRWVEEYVNKYAVKNGVSTLPTVSVDSATLDDPAVELPVILEDLRSPERDE